MEVKSVANQANRVMQQRESIKTYDETVKIEREEMFAILKDATTAPSRFNLQPWRFIVIESKDAKEKIRPYIQGNVSQLETSAAMIVVLADTMNSLSAEAIYSATVACKLMPENMKTMVLSLIESDIAAKTKEVLTREAFFDCGLVAMQIMLAAKQYGYDTNPIGGFMINELAKALDLDTGRYIPALIISIGKGKEEAYQSVRFNVDNVATWM